MDDTRRWLYVSTNDGHAKYTELNLCVSVRRDISSRATVIIIICMWKKNHYIYYVNNLHAWFGRHDHGPGVYNDCASLSFLHCDRMMSRAHTNSQWFMFAYIGDALFCPPFVRRRFADSQAICHMNSLSARWIWACALVWAWACYGVCGHIIVLALFEYVLPFHRVRSSHIEWRCSNRSHKAESATMLAGCVCLCVCSTIATSTFSRRNSKAEKGVILRYLVQYFMLWRW